MDEFANQCKFEYANTPLGIYNKLNSRLKEISKGSSCSK